MSLDFDNSRLIDSPLSALVWINQSLRSNDSTNSTDADYLLRPVNFMYYELASLTSGLPDDELFASLNHYLFDTKKFQIAAVPVLLDEILADRRGCYSAIALLYMHLGCRLGLKIDFLRWPNRAILKWECQGRSRYVNLEECGRFLTEDELLNILNNERKDSIASLSLQESVVQYLTYLSFYYRQYADTDRLHKTFGMILSFEPDNMRILAERALLRRDLGLLKDALQDMKRYFSFNEKVNSNSDLALVYEELKSRVSPPL